MRNRLIGWRAPATAGMILLSLATLSYGSSVSAVHSVTGVTLSPSTPNLLVHNQNVSVSFSYTTTEPGGVRIYARPFVGASPAPGYAASGAGLSPTGSGTGTQTFTITTGNVTVNRIRLQMMTANQSQVLFEAFLPVHYEFRAP